MVPSVATMSHSESFAFLGCFSFKFKVNNLVWGLGGCWSEANNFVNLILFTSCSEPPQALSAEANKRGLSLNRTAAGCRPGNGQASVQAAGQMLSVQGRQQEDT
jgi:hypothetical protein